MNTNQTQTTCVPPTTCCLGTTWFPLCTGFLQFYFSFLFVLFVVQKKNLCFSIAVCCFPSEMTVIKTNPTERVLLKSLSICIWPLAVATHTEGVQSVLLLLAVILFRLTWLKLCTTLCFFSPGMKRLLLTWGALCPVQTALWTKGNTSCLHLTWIVPANWATQFTENKMACCYLGPAKVQSDLKEPFYIFEPRPYPL